MIITRVGEVHIRANSFQELTHKLYQDHSPKIDFDQSMNPIDVEGVQLTAAAAPELNGIRIADLQENAA